jgi:hypothetical protein
VKYILGTVLLLSSLAAVADAQGNRAVCSTQCILPVPVEPGGTLVAMGIWPLGMTSTSISDLQQSKWTFMGFLNGRTICVWYALEVAGGTETVTLPPGPGVQAIVAEYPPSSGVDDNSMGQYDNGGGDLVADTQPVTTSERGDFVIGLFSDWPSHGGIATKPDCGYQIVASIGWLTLIDKMGAAKGTYSPSLTYAEPVLYDNWVIAFKLAR